MEKEKIIVGMSGGVDSSVAACLLKQQGYDVIGLTMVNFHEDPCGSGEENNTGRIVEDAAKVADYLGIPHYVVDMSSCFKKDVIDYFIREYLSGRTPNPCVACNRSIKWKAMLQEGEKLGARLIATGHYAKVKLLENGRYTVQCSAAASKDQTYVLYGLTQEQLSRTRMPLGSYTKEEIRNIAKETGIPVAHKPDSMEICFVTDQDYAGFIKKHVNITIPEGNFINQTGNVIGQHKGIIHYTVGQRKGLGLALGHPAFVTEIRPKTNEVVIGENQDVYAPALICSGLNAMAVPCFEDGMEVTAKIRYNHKGAPAVLRVVGEDQLLVHFREPQRAITPGQSVVFYKDGYVTGGGIIGRCIREETF